MTRLHGSSSFPLTFVAKANALNGAELLAEALPTLAGNTRLMAEWVDGTTTAGVQPCAPITPHSGTPGHDHSGGTMGKPIVRTLWSSVWGKGNAEVLALGGGWSGGQAPQVTVGASITIKWLYSGHHNTIWIPNCPPGGAHLRGQLFAGIYADAAASLTLVWGKNMPWEVSGSVTLTAATLQEVALQVPLVPGRRQYTRIEVYVEYTTATAKVSLDYLRLDTTAINP